MMNANSNPNSGPGTPHHHHLMGLNGGGGSTDGGSDNGKNTTITTSGVRVKLRGQTGSIRYMAPEVALGTPYDETVDIYSMSLVAWEAIHLRKPFHGLNVDSHRRVVCLGLGREEVMTENHVFIIVKRLYACFLLWFERCYRNVLRPFTVDSRSRSLFTRVVVHQIDKAVPLGLAQLIRAGWDNEPDRRPTLPQAAEALQVLMLEAVASQHEGARLPLPGGGAAVPHGQPGAHSGAGGFAGHTPHPFAHANHQVDQATAANAAAVALIQQQAQQAQQQQQQYLEQQQQQRQQQYLQQYLQRQQQQQQQSQVQKSQQPPPQPHPPQRSGSSSLFGLFGHKQTPKTGPSESSHHGQRPEGAARNP